MLKQHYLQSPELQLADQEIIKMENLVKKYYPLVEKVMNGEIEDHTECKEFKETIEAINTNRIKYQKNLRNLVSYINKTFTAYTIHITNYPQIQDFKSVIIVLNSNKLRFKIFLNLSLLVNYYYIGYGDTTIPVYFWPKKGNISDKHWSNIILLDNLVKGEFSHFQLLQESVLEQEYHQYFSMGCSSAKIKSLFFYDITEEF